MKTPAVLSFDDLAPRGRSEHDFRAVRIVRKGKLVVAQPVEPSEPLTAEAVRQIQMELRAERGKV
jgi:hypothetical protein